MLSKLSLAGECVGKQNIRPSCGTFEIKFESRESEFQAFLRESTWPHLLWLSQTLKEVQMAFSEEQRFKGSLKPTPLKACKHHLLKGPFVSGEQFSEQNCSIPAPPCPPRPTSCVSSECDPRCWSRAWPFWLPWASHIAACLPTAYWSWVETSIAIGTWLHSH